MDRTDSWMVRNAAATNIRVRRARARRGVGLLQPGWLPRPRQCSLHDWARKGPHWGCCCPVTKDVSGVSRALWTKPLPIFTWADVPSILHCKSPAETQVLSHRPWGPQRHGVSRFAEARFARSPSAAPACGARGDAPRLLPGGLRPQLSRSSLQLALKNRARVQPRACRKRPPVGAPQAVCSPTGSAPVAVSGPDAASGCPSVCRPRPRQQTEGAGPLLDPRPRLLVFWVLASARESRTGPNT